MNKKISQWIKWLYYLTLILFIFGSIFLWNRYGNITFRSNQFTENILTVVEWNRYIFRVKNKSEVKINIRGKIKNKSYEFQLEDLDMNSFESDISSSQEVSGKEKIKIKVGTYDQEIFYIPKDKDLNQMIEIKKRESLKFVLLFLLPFLIVLPIKILIKKKYEKS